ncbi:hypothetical protein [Tenacibaculum sp. IB213877]|uniref:hypothetical protein n=1 Tax=Tenacibaculum sp. IB213877 TaxID=3097351 RepID=UPI002A5A0780|nr:hypothetical protein [Tenacibaculum sp. IB213877]MDY0780818.1 hypothetical protein [Tenacibaculum sp. IB213877]
MKTQILSLGKALNRTEQKLINGGGPLSFCAADGSCPEGYYCEGYVCLEDNSGGSGGTGGGNPGGCVPDRFCVDEFDTCCIG